MALGIVKLGFIGLCAWLLPLTHIDVALPDVQSASEALTEKWLDASMIVFAKRAYEFTGTIEASRLWRRSVAFSPKYRQEFTSSA
jgi:hypothetical protein